MHILFVHKNFPAQFGHIARYLVRELGWQATFVCELPDGIFDGVRRIQYRVRGAATRQNHYLSRTFENYIWHSHAVYETLKAHPEISPDLIVGHSGFGSTVFLGDLYDCPVVNYCEYFYRSRESDMDFRPDFPTTELNTLRIRARNAMLLLDLQTCAAAYSPTHWQRSRFPAEYQTKIETIFDGIDTGHWQRLSPDARGPRMVGGRAINPDTKVVTYVSRGFESMRGFDIFMKVAKRICQARSDVIFVCVGSDRVCYGGDEAFLEGRSFREWVLAQDAYELDRFVFTGRVPPAELVRIFNFSDLHIYLTVPFVLSWSLLNAMACGCTVLASDTPPVREVVENGNNGLLAGFFDIDRLAEIAIDVLDRPDQYRSLGEAATRLVEEKYSERQTFPHLLAFFERVREGYRSTGQPLAATLHKTRQAVRRRPHSAGPAPVSRASTSVVPPHVDDAGMKIVVAIPHFYDPRGRRLYGSTRDAAATRARALSGCVSALHELYGGVQYTTNLARTGNQSANSATKCQIDVFVCTSGGRHVLDQLSMPAGYFTHAPQRCDGRLLGFACRRLLGEVLGKYHYYCYLEDDLQLHDPWFFAKLRAFTSQAGAECVLQPNRYEGLHGSPPLKAYVDGDLDLAATSRFQDVSDRAEILLRFLDMEIRCRRPSNPHSGCYFVNDEQMRYWTSRADFAEIDTGFYGPFESAATLGLMKTFRVYKPASEAANFLEIQHSGAAQMKRIAARDARFKSAEPRSENDRGLR